MASSTKAATRATGKASAAKGSSDGSANGTDPVTNLPDRRAADRTYDAIVIGGGHNGLVNGAYLAKNGLKTLILERRHLVGGAAITEELRPGFWFTTFSYALSLLRPDIIHDLELTKHGFMPLLMPSTFAPMENGDYLLLGQDHGENLREIARHSAARRRRLRGVQPRRPPGLPGDQAAPRPGAAGHLQQRPRGARSPSPSLGSRFRSLDKKVLHDAVRLLTGSAADFLDDYFESEILKGYLGLVLDHRDEGRAVLAGLGARPALPHPRRARRRVRGVGVPQAGQRRVHQGPCPGRPVVRSGDRPRVAGRPT